MKTSDTMKEILPALLKAQLVTENPSFDKLNPHFKSKYASLASVRAAVLPPLLQNGIIVTQSLTNNEKGDICCVTRLSHVSGEFMEDSLSLPSDRASGQGFASAATYARRLSLQAFVCVVGDNDDDGEQAEKRTRKNASAKSVSRDVLDSLPTDTQSKLLDLSIPIKDALADGNADRARELYLAAKESFGDDESLVFAFWDFFHSSEKSTLKKAA
jgi:hypothetical protein